MAHLPFLKKLVRDQSGGSAAEYGLIIAIVGVGIGAAALALGENVAVSVNDVATDMIDVNTAPSGTPT